MEQGYGEEMWEASTRKYLSIGLPPRISDNLNDLDGGVHNFLQYLYGR